MNKNNKNQILMCLYHKLIGITPLKELIFEIFTYMHIVNKDPIY